MKIIVFCDPPKDSMTGSLYGGAWEIDRNQRGHWDGTTRKLRVSRYDPTIGRHVTAGQGITETVRTAIKT